MSKPTSIDEKDYQARDDARHLTESMKIQGDPKRLSRAKVALDGMTKEARDTMRVARAAKGLKRVFGH